MSQAQVAFEDKKKYKVRAVDAGLSEAKSGAAQAYVKFETVAEPKQSITWFQIIKGGAAEIAAKDLITAGFKGNDFEDLKKPFDMMFANAPEVSITIAVEDYQGKKQTKVKYINAGGPKQYKGAAPKLAGAFAKARNELGVKASTGTTANKTEDIPF